MSKARQRSGPRKRREHIDPFAQFRLMRNLQPFTPAELRKLNLKPRLAWEAMRTGHATDDDRGTISAVVNASTSRVEASSGRPSGVAPISSLPGVTPDSLRSLA